jgi:hypothetical protein
VKHARSDYNRIQDPAGIIPADEPVFLLRGQDVLAHIAVRHYAFMAAQADRLEIAAAANAHAELMMVWAKKLPDMPAEGAALNPGIDEFPHTVESSRGWMETARRYARNADFYRKLVVEIGDLFGEAARTSDDGTVQDSVLALKVPELVRSALNGGAREIGLLIGRAMKEGHEQGFRGVYTFTLGGVGFGDATDAGDWKIDLYAAESDVGGPVEYAEARLQHHVEETQRLALLVRSLGGDPEPGHDQPDWLERPIPEDLSFPGQTFSAGVSLGVVYRAARRWKQDAMDKTKLAIEVAAICNALGCIDKPGVPLRFVRQLIEANSNHAKRQVELLRTWDPATPTERQELDRMRRGWGPSSPTERQRRQADVMGCLQVISGAMSDLQVDLDMAESVGSEILTWLEAAHDRLDKRHTEMLAIVTQMQVDPQEWPDIKAAEERGAMQAQIAPNKILIDDNRRMRAAGLKLSEAAIYVVREFDGTHRLALAAAEWIKVIGDEGDRGERHAIIEQIAAAFAVPVDRDPMSELRAAAVRVLTSSGCTGPESDAAMEALEKAVRATPVPERIPQAATQASEDGDCGERHYTAEETTDILPDQAEKSEIGDLITAGLDDVLAYLGGDKSRATLLTVKDGKVVTLQESAEARAIEPGRTAFEARHPEPREVEWDEMDTQQQNMWVRVEIAVRHGPEAVAGR